MYREVNENTIPLIVLYTAISIQLPATPSKALNIIPSTKPIAIISFLLPVLSAVIPTGRRSTIAKIDGNAIIIAVAIAGGAPNTKACIAMRGAYIPSPAPASKADNASNTTGSKDCFC